MSLKWSVNQWTLHAILIKYLAKEPLTNVQFNLGFKNFITKTSLEDKGSERFFAMDDDQLKANIKADSCKTT
uniref:Uncharacterized protein n=1 Tax=Heterorhabditis bacteriophora TaxID=37862 RepID=A0A1I7XDD3_HETBA